MSPETDSGGDFEKRLERVEAGLRSLLGGAIIDTVPLHIFPNGQVPKRQTEGAIGFDAYSRAIVDANSAQNAEQHLRRTRADFMKTDGWEARIDTELIKHMEDDPKDPDKYAIALPAGERCMVGLGFATAMNFPLFYWVAPRSGFASRGITLGNAPGTVDPDYRGEAGALIVNNSSEPFKITHDMRIAQVIFSLAVIPDFEVVDELEHLPESGRGAGGFGSTGSHG